MEDGPNFEPSSPGKLTMSSSFAGQIQKNMSSSISNSYTKIKEDNKP